MLTVWTDSLGRILLDDAGKAYYCDHCPCAIGPVTGSYFCLLCYSTFYSKDGAEHINGVSGTRCSCPSVASLGFQSPVVQHNWTAAAIADYLNGRGAQKAGGGEITESDIEYGARFWTGCAYEGGSSVGHPSGGLCAHDNFVVVSGKVGSTGPACDAMGRRHMLEISSESAEGMCHGGTGQGCCRSWNLGPKDIGISGSGIGIWRSSEYYPARAGMIRFALAPSAYVEDSPNTAPCVTGYAPSVTLSGITVTGESSTFAGTEAFAGGTESAYYTLGTVPYVGSSNGIYFQASQDCTDDAPESERTGKTVTWGDGAESVAHNPPSWSTAAWFREDGALPDATDKVASTLTLFRRPESEYTEPAAFNSLTYNTLTGKSFPNFDSVTTGLRAIASVYPYVSGHVIRSDVEDATYPAGKYCSSADLVVYRGMPDKVATHVYARGIYADQCSKLLLHTTAATTGGWYGKLGGTESHCWVDFQRGTGTLGEDECSVIFNDALDGKPHPLWQRSFVDSVDPYMNLSTGWIVPDPANFKFDPDIDHVYTDRTVIQPVQAGADIRYEVIENNQISLDGIPHYYIKATMRYTGPPPEEQRIWDYAPQASVELVMNAGIKSFKELKADVDDPEKQTKPGGFFNVLYAAKSDYSDIGSKGSGSFFNYTYGIGAPRVNKARFIKRCIDSAMQYRFGYDMTRPEQYIPDYDAEFEASLDSGTVSGISAYSEFTGKYVYVYDVVNSLYPPSSQYAPGDGFERKDPLFFNGSPALADSGVCYPGEFRHGGELRWSWPFAQDTPAQLPYGQDRYVQIAYSEYAGQASFYPDHNYDKLGLHIGVETSGPLKAWYPSVASGLYIDFTYCICSIFNEAVSISANASVEGGICCGGMEWPASSSSLPSTASYYVPSPENVTVEVYAAGTSHVVGSSEVPYTDPGTPGEMANIGPTFQCTSPAQDKDEKEYLARTCQSGYRINYGAQAQESSPVALALSQLPEDLQ